MAMAYLICEKGMAPEAAQKELSRIRPHVSPRLWKRQAVKDIHRRQRIREQQMEKQLLEAQASARESGSPLAGARAPLRSLA